MNNWPLQRRLLFISLLPLIVVTIILSAYYMKSSINSLRQQTLEHGQLLASQLAPAVEYGVISGNQKSLNRIIINLLEHDSVVRVSIRDNEDHDLASAYRENPEQKTSERIFDYIFELLSGIHKVNDFKEDIQSEPVILDDYAAEISSHLQQETIGYVSVEVSLSASAYEQFKSILSGFLIAIFILVSVFFFVLHTSRQITEAINEMAGTVSKIQSGDLNVRSQVDAGAELLELRNGINAMAENIYQSKENLQYEVDQATAELVTKNQALEEAERDAVAASEAKSVFLANMSHEIRTPMNGILGFIDVLLKTSLSTQQRNYSETIRSASHNLMLLINDILDFSRIESGKMPTESVPYEINSLLSELYTLHSQSAFNKGIELLFYVEEDIPSKGEFDPKLLKQVIMNLISNAIKFTESGHVHVVLRYSRAAQKLTVQVKDTGIGLKEQRLKGIFNEFEQGDNSTARQYGGSGLGLAITNRIVTLLGGSIKAYNYRHGACFEFVIPMPEVAPAPYSQSGPHLALIGNDSLTIECFSSVLKRYGFTVYTPQAENIVSSHYQAILYLMSPTDIHYRVPGRSDSIAFVSTNNPEDLEAVKEWGFGRAIHKTINPAELNDILFDQHYNPVPELTSQTGTNDAQHSPSNNILSGLHILVVDDNHVNLTLMDTYLSDLGAEVLMCDNGERAIQVAQSNHVDLVFLDVHMPGMDGFETARSIRKLGFSSDMFPIIGLSADGVGNVRKKAAEAGMDDYVLKPVSQQKLIEVIQYHLKGKLEDPKQPQSVMPSSSEESLKVELTEMLLKDLPEMMQELENAVAHEDVDQVFQIAHKLHGACIYCDMPQVEAASVALEIACRNRDASTLHKLFKQLQGHVAEFIQSQP